MAKKIDEKEEVLVRKIEEEKKEREKIPVEEQKKIHKRMFTNLVIAAVIILYFIFMILGYMNITREAFLTDLRVFSIGILIGAIILFEKSYKKDDEKLALYGIETLAVAIVTLVAIYVCLLFETKFVMLVSIISYAFAIYYIVKACIISKRMTKAYIESQNDIKEIVKKEKPEKVTETKKKENKTKTVQEKKSPSKKGATQKKTVATKKKEETKKETKTTKKTTTSTTKAKKKTAQETKKPKIEKTKLEEKKEKPEKQTASTKKKSSSTPKKKTTTKTQTTKKKAETKKEE